MGQASGWLRLVGKGLLSIIIAMVIFGTISVFVKNIGISSGEIALWRAVIAVAVLLLYKLIKREKLPFYEIRSDILPLLISGAAIGFNWVLLFEAYSYTSVSVATLCYYFCPVLVMVLSPILFKERVTFRQCLCFAFATAGLVLIIGARSAGGENELMGILLGLGAACLYAFIVLMNKRIKTVGGVDKTIYQFLGVIVVLIIYVPLTSGFHVAELSGWGQINLLILGAVHTGLAYCLYFTAVGKLSGQKIALLSYIDPLVAVIVSIAFLEESITALQLFGGALILGFTLLNELNNAKTNKAAD